MIENGVLLLNGTAIELEWSSLVAAARHARNGTRLSRSAAKKLISGFGPVEYSDPAPGTAAVAYEQPPRSHTPPRRRSTALSNYTMVA